MGKAEKVHFSVYFVLRDTRMWSTSAFMNSRGQCHLVTMAKGHLACLPSFSKDFSSETTEPISIKFYMQPSDKGRKKICTFGPGHMPIYSKNL